MSILELRQVSKSFGALKAVNGVSMGFEQGKITGLIGPNGAGKTTVFNLISGFHAPDDGTIHYKDNNITHLRPWNIFGLGVGRLFQDVRVFAQMTVMDNIMVAFRRQSGENPLLALCVPLKCRKEEALFSRRAVTVLDALGLADKAGDLADNLSYGQQKLLAIGRLLASDADALLLDEPTAGLNPMAAVAIQRLIRGMASQGKTIVVIEHNMNVVIEICDWVYFMDHAQVTSFGTPRDVLGNPEVRSDYIGI